ncbi:hypothetical protein CUV01_15460 [Paracoccus tegillarcae]|uniref:Uncharacterized protein n=1 Tax=Paracoccus tegillarcae TaxID=1529068 RepID=A0A2K9F2K1_9RHOB|nr:hypothetical protein CUV01_15460 [Paracoccus tegillarcae]
MVGHFLSCTNKKPHALCSYRPNPPFAEFQRDRMVAFAHLEHQKQIPYHLDGKIRLCNKRQVASGHPVRYAIHNTPNGPLFNAVIEPYLIQFLIDRSLSN